MNSFQACVIQKTREFQGLFFPPFLIAQTNCMYPSSSPGTSVTELKGWKLHFYRWKSEKLPERQLKV